MSEYVTLTKEDVEEFLNSYNATPVFKLNVKEYIYKIPTDRQDVSIIIYSSVDTKTNETRGVGEDAIRVILWSDKENHPLGKGKKVYRVTNKESVLKRVEQRIQDFMKQSVKVVLVDWDYCKAVLWEAVRRQPNNNFVNSLYDTVKDRGKLSQGQVVYVLGEFTPKGRTTLEQQLKDSHWEYVPTFDDDVVDEMTDEQLSASLSSKEKYEVITHTFDIQLISTKGYNYPFEFFNPVQSMVYPFKDENCNIVISASTSAGKTICAELLMEEIFRG